MTQRRAILARWLGQVLSPECVFAKSLQEPVDIILSEDDPVFNQLKDPADRTPLFSMGAPPDDSRISQAGGHPTTIRDLALD